MSYKEPLIFDVQNTAMVKKTNLFINSICTFRANRNVFFLKVIKLPIFTRLKKVT
ncbi:hypothetical protein ALT1000_60071 [Alteromonas macleodii]